MDDDDFFEDEEDLVEEDDTYRGDMQAAEQTQEFWNIHKLVKVRLAVK